MWENPLSYVILEFFTWNPKWDTYLTKIIEDIAKKHEENKTRCNTDKCNNKR